ncbi:MAG: hypothetical protein GY811_02955 [Myxococcales bacterium]|nr:hypothetical protein [Myxococcales bacterium]
MQDRPASEAGGFAINIAKAKKPASGARRTPPPAEPAAKPRSERPLTADDLFADEPSHEEDQALSAQSISVPQAQSSDDRTPPPFNARKHPVDTPGLQHFRGDRGV